MTIDLKIASEKDAEEWDTLVESSPHGTLFHTWKWLKIMEKNSGSKLYPMIGYKGGEIIGIFPLFQKNKKILRGVYSPIGGVETLYQGPVLVEKSKRQSKKESEFTEFIKQIDQFILAILKSNYISLSSPPGLFDCRAFKWNGYQAEPRYTYVIDLTDGEEEVWNSFNKQHRNDIKRVNKKGIYIEEGFSKEDVGNIYNLLLKRRTEQGIPTTSSEEYLLDIYNSFYPENLKIFVAKFDNRIVSGLFSILYKNKASIWVGTPRSIVNGTSPNDLLIWEAIRYACDHGFEYYEEIGANSKKLCKFKSKFNPDPVIYFSYRKYSPFVKYLLKPLYQIVKPKLKEI